MRIPKVLLAALTAAAVGSAFAEQPRFETLTTRIHALQDAQSGLDTALSGEGIWSFDPGPGRWLRLAPYSGLTRVGLAESNGMTRLQLVEDRIVIQSWPGVLELDSVTFRVLRRTPPFAEPELWGWGLLGPVVGGAEAKVLGLAAGTYGAPWCGLPDLYGTSRPCPPHQFPGMEAPNEIGDSRVILFRSGSPDRTGHSLAFSLKYSQWPTLGRNIGIDFQRRDWWAISSDTVVFMLVRPDGAGAPSGSVKPSLPPSGFYPSQMWTWLPGKGQQPYLAAISDSQDGATVGYRQFISLTDDFQPATVFSSFKTWDAKPLPPLPISLSRFTGALPEEYEQAIPIIGHAKGERGTYWTSDLWLFNPSDETTRVHIRRVTAPDTDRALELLPHASRRIDDALSWVGGGPSGDGVEHDGLVITSPYRWGVQLVATSRTFTPAPETELRAGGGTMGHAVTALPTRLGYSNHFATFDNRLTVSENGNPAQILLDLRQDRRFRHNLGVVNDTADVLEVTLWWPFFRLPLGLPPEGGEQHIVVPPPHREGHRH